MTGMLDAIPPVVDVVTKGTDWPTIVTGVVGVAGIIGTYWQGKRAREATSRDLRDSLSAETDRALRADRRIVYARFFAVVNKTLNATLVLVAEWNASQEEATRRALRSAHADNMTELYAAVAEVRLIAPAAIGDEVGAVSRLFTDYVNALLRDEAPDYKAFSDDVTGRAGPLRAAMQADLVVSAKPVASPPPSA